LSGRGLCDGPIPRPEESYRLWCVSECDQVKINNLDTCCEEVEEGRTAKRNDKGAFVIIQYCAVSRCVCETLIHVTRAEYLPFKEQDVAAF
jgi:hypothetical protein